MSGTLTRTRALSLSRTPIRLGSLLFPFVGAVVHVNSPLSLYDCSLRKPHDSFLPVLQRKHEARVTELQNELEAAQGAAERAIQACETGEEKLIVVKREHASAVGTLESQLRSAHDAFAQLEVGTSENAGMWKWSLL